MKSAQVRLSLLIAATAVLAVTGCAKPYLKHAANTPDPKPSEALVTGLTVRFDSGGQEKGLLDAAVDAAQNSKLQEFGTKAATLFAAALAEHGYTLTYDASRTSRLDAVQLASNSATAALTGLWRHPETSHWTPDAMGGFGSKPADVIGKIKKDGKEYFAFGEVVIRDTGMFMKEPYVVVRAAVYDQDARKVLDLQGLGSGDSSFMFANRDPKNLELALQRGFESLKTVQAQALE